MSEIESVDSDSDNVPGLCNHKDKLEPHPCPFAEEIHNSPTLCTCCEWCTEQCARDI